MKLFLIKKIRSIKNIKININNIKYINKWISSLKNTNSLINKVC